MPTNKSIISEIVNKRTLNSKHYLLSDGSYQAVISMGQIHFDDGEGNLHNINTDLFDEADFDSFDGPVNKHGKDNFHAMKGKAIADKKANKLNRDNFDYQGLQVPFEVKIPRNIKRGYTIGKGADKLTFKPVGASPAKGYVDEDATNRIHYQDAWNDTDVTLELTDRGIKETIILKTDRAPSSFSFEVDGDIADDLSAGEFKLQPAWLEDAIGTKKDVTQTVRHENNKVYVDMTADVSGLVYPIDIDPTVTITSNTQDQYYYISSSSHYSLTDKLNISSVYNSLIQFDISSIPNGSPITSANLSLTIAQNPAGNNGVFAYLHRITSSWDENTINNSNVPGYVGANGSVGNFNNSYSNANITGTTGTSYTLDITQMVDEWKNKGKSNYGIFILGTDNGGSIAYVASSRYAGLNYRPSLTVTYNEPPTAPTVITPNGGETWNAQETITWNPSSDDGTPSNQSGTYNLTSNYIQISLSSQPTYIHITSQASSDYITYDASVGTDRYVENGQTKYFSGEGGYVNNTGFKFWTNWTIGTLNWQVTLNATSSIQYQIQVSSDNGATWSDIIALTSAGATIYLYDFSNTTQTSTALIRIRGYDGASYGPWDTSDGVFTITHNQAPTAPSNLSPSGGTSKDRNQTVRYEWQHNDPNSGDPQSQFDFQWRVKGNTTWNTVTQSTPNQFYDMPGGTLPHGDIEWQVRTYDQAGLSSPYSALATFLAGDKPNAPTITAPLDGDTVAVANPTVQWSSSGQTGFALAVRDSNGTQVYTANGTTNKAHTVQYDLANESTYTIDVTISNTDNLSSDPDNAGITVSYTPPADPILSTQIDSVRGSITVHIDNPVPSGTEPNVSYNDIYRCKQGETDFIRIGVNIPNDGSFTDYTPASDQVYEYYVRVYGDNGTFNDSAIISDSVAVSDAQIALTTDYSQVANVVLNNQSGGPQRDFKHSVDRATMTFAGREYPVAEFSEFDSLSAGLSFIVQTKADIDMLRKLAYSRQTLLYRDSRGRREFVTLDGLDESDIINGWYSVSVSPLRVSFSEVV